MNELQKQRRGSMMLEALVALGLLSSLVFTLGTLLSNGRASDAAAWEQFAARQLMESLLEREQARPEARATPAEGEALPLDGLLPGDLPLVLPRASARVFREHAPAERGTLLRIRVRVEWSPGDVERGDPASRMEYSTLRRINP
jgi:hypothetical protein